jgi:histone-binding protein RBBP4
MAKVGPQLRCTGHTKEGFGLDWSIVEPGYLASGADDQLVCVWNTSSTNEAYNLMLLPLVKFEEHTDVVEDVSWSTESATSLVSVGDDRQMIFWDIRQSQSASKIE